jgi:SNF2 family DNA or RNA helicase
VFAVHREVIDRLVAGLTEAGHGPVVVIDGRQTLGARNHAITSFQRSNDPPRVCIVQIAAGAVGITLTRASDGFVLEPDWVPGVNAQAIARLHRIGQNGGVLVRFLFVPGSLDARIMGVFRRKAEDLALAF